MLRNRARALSYGFTLVELLAVVAIIVLLTALIVPNIVGARTRAAVRKTEADIKNLATALENYRQAFGTYPGDVFPSEDVNNNGVLDTGEDVGVDVDGDGTRDYALTANGRIDAGDGVVNILDLEWALRTTARGGPFIDDMSVDGWGQQYVYCAPMIRSVSNQDFLYLNPAGAGNNITSEDQNRNGILDAGEDIGIAQYATANADVVAGFTAKRAGAGNGILDHGDDDNKDGSITYADDGVAQPNTAVVSQWELGNLDISPDGYARNRGFYIYSVGVDGVDSSASGYEDISSDNILTTSLTGATTGTVRNNLGGNSEDLDPDGGGALVASTDLDTGFMDTGLDGRPNTHDQGEGDGLLSTGTAPTNEQMANYNGLAADGTASASVVDQYHPLVTAGDEIPVIDDINSWNDTAPWRNHASYN